MANNVAGGVEIPLDVFGGLCTEIGEAGLPEGLSPDCQDVVFQPHRVSSRPGLRAVYATPFPNGVTVVYGKDYVTPKGDIHKLYLCSDGILYVEDFTNAPGTRTPILASTPGSYARSISAFNREYIAISDKLHGADIPVQWDGEYLDRVTQDGPGAPPAVDNLALPSVTMAASGAPAALTVVSGVSTGLGIDGHYHTVTFTVTAGASALVVGSAIVIAGNAWAPFNGTWGIAYVVDDTHFTVWLYQGFVLKTGAGGTATPYGGAVTMVRSNNIVTVTTATAHGLKVGYLAKISKVAASVVGTAISSIVINNQNDPGIATVTTTADHGLSPDCLVNITGVAQVAVGTAISAVSRYGGLLTIQTSGKHGLSVGANVSTSGVATANLNTSGIVSIVLDEYRVAFNQSGADAVDVAGGTLYLTWPVPDAPSTQYRVLTCPTSTSFTIEFHYSNGTWTTGSVTMGWDGTFYVTATPTTTSFQYKQNGPNATTTDAGTVLPFGQLAPGKRQVRVSFLTRNGAITKPSPPVSITCPGGQYLAISNLPIGPANVIARVIQITEANGASFFYIPTTPKANGQTVGTSTQVDDNTTTSATLDFGDPTLASGICTSEAGNDLASQAVLDGALSFGAYASRLLTFGQRNTVQSLMNMAFDGGYLPSASTLPAGWTVEVAGGALVTTGRWGFGYKITAAGAPAAGTISQTMYQDAYGAPIAEPNTKYRFRCWCKLDAASALNLIAEISSASTAFSTTATIAGAGISTTGGWLEATFDAKTPNEIPSDLLLKVYVSGAAGIITLDEMSVLYDAKPYTDELIRASYVNNPEGFDGVTGVLGSAQDARKVMAAGIIRDTLYFVTRDPRGQLHETIDNATTEPSGWLVRDVAADCGAVSAFGITAAEEWLMWVSASGVRIFDGGAPKKINQEIQPDFDSINKAAWTSIWALNDPDARRAYFGLPMNSATAPSLIYPVDYRWCKTAYQIVEADPFQIAFSGKMGASDRARKWTRWNMTMNGAALMLQANGSVALTLFGGNGLAPNAEIGFGNVYTLSGDQCLYDDDYGAMYPWYVTFFFVNSDTEQALQLGSHRKMVCYFQATISGGGYATITPYVNKLSNAWTVTVKRALAAQPKFDLEWNGGQATGQRIAFKVAWSVA